VKIVFVVPGTLGKPDFDDFEVAPASGRNKTIQVFAAVPDDIARSKEPMDGLIDLARSAIDYAHAHEAKGRLEVAEINRELDLAQAAVGGRGNPSRRRKDGPALAGRVQTRDGDEDAPAGARIRLPIGESRHATEAAFALESELENRLEPESVGYVDGNEVGQGVFEIFVYGPSIDALRDAILEVVRERWILPGATVSMLEGDVEVELLTV
jgi:hypothetical protein